MNTIERKYIDDLTGLYNRRYLFLQASKKIRESRSNEEPLSIVFIDLDHFKNVNDTYGHTRGDTVLKDFGKFLKTLLRKDDTVFRYGGDEFICILPNTDYEQASNISLRFIELCRRREFSKVRLTLSLGIASFPEQEKNWKGLFEVADRNLYSAKRHGRDQIGIFTKKKKKSIIPIQEIIGRNKEIGRIKEFIDPIFSGRGGAMCISGEVGVGKTRLVQAVVKESDFQGFQFININLSATTESIPYYPFREIIRTFIDQEGLESIKEIPDAYQIELTKIVPELSDKSPLKKGILVVDKFRLFEGVRRLLKLECSTAPLFVSIDNANWADDVSLELLHYLVRTLKESPVFFFLVYRIEEATDSFFKKILHLMARESLYGNIELEPLKIADVARMLSFIIDSGPSSELTDYIFKETGGNPFFIEELMKSLEADDALFWNEEKWLFDADKKVVIPDSIEGVVERKVGMLKREAYDVIEYASVIGREFTFAFLKEITRMNEGELFDLMDKILEMRLLQESGGECYCFTEAIIREIIYQRIQGVKLKHYHQRVGEELLNLYKGRTREAVEELSHHFYLAGDSERAIEYSIIAGDRAKDVYANRDTIRFYTRAIEYLPESEIDEKEIKEVECLKKRAEVLNLIGENEKAVSDVNTAINKAKATGNRKLEADCLIMLCRIYQDTAQYNEAAQKAEIALEIYRDLNNREGEALTLRDIATVYFYIGKYSTSLEYYQHSLKIREQIEDRKGEAQSLNNIGVVHDHLGNYPKALELYERSLKIVKEIGDLKLESAILNNIGLVNQNFGNYPEALEFYQRSLKIMEEIGHRRGEAQILNNIGSIYHNLSEYSEALEFYRSALKIMRETSNRQAEATILYNIGIIIHNLGDYSKALEFYQRSLKITEEIGDRKIEAANLLSIGGIYTETDDFLAAEKHLHKAYSIAKEIKSKLLQTYVLLGRTSLYLEKDSPVEAEKALEQLLSLADELGSKEVTAETLYFYGRFHTKKKKWDKAKSSFEESIKIFEKIKNKYNIGQVYYYQGLMYEESGDKTNAKERYTKAREIFKEMGAKGWIEKLKK